MVKNQCHSRSNSICSYIEFAIYIIDAIVYKSQYFRYKSYYLSSPDIRWDNSINKIWDAKHGVLCHSRAISELNDLGLVSAYHHIMKEEQGEETTPTFYLYKHIDKPYHLDYAFAAPSIIKSFRVADTEWLDKSDHLPIALEIDEESIKTQSNNMILADNENVDV